MDEAAARFNTVWVRYLYLDLRGDRDWTLALATVWDGQARRLARRKFPRRGSRQ